MTSRGPAPAPQVCVQPALVRFQDVRVGQVYRCTLTVRNAGTSSARMRLLGPVSKMFRLRVRNPRSPVPAGLSLTATVEFRAERDEDVRDRLLLHYEDEVAEVPLLAFPPSCSLHVDLLVDFGTVVANQQTISREVELTNQGSAPGVFSIMYHGKTPLSIVPHCGTVGPGSHQTIKVELRADGPRRVNEEARVVLQGRENQVLRIQVEMVEHVLELLDASGREKLTCLRFGPAYFGTSRVERIILRNKGPEACDWVALLLDDAPGTEMGTDLWRSTDAALLDTHQMRRVDTCSVVSCVPCEGRLGPDESVHLGVCFSPMEISSCPGDEEGDTAATRRDFSLFLKFDIVGSRDTCTHPQTCTHLQPWEAPGCRGGGRRGSAELAVTGVGLPPSLRPQPGHTFSFQQCMMGQSVGVLCILQNTCPLLPAAFSFRKTANFFSRPSRGHIPPGQEQEVTLTFTPHHMGTFRVRQLVEVLGQVAHLSAGSLWLRSQPFSHVVLHLSAVCSGMAVHVPPPLRPGISSTVSRRTGAHCRTLFTTVQKLCYGDTEKKVLERKHNFLFTRALQRSPLQAAREPREEDSGCLPAAGLQSPKISLMDLRSTKAEGSKTPPEGRLLSSCALVAMETRCASRQVTVGLSAEPSTAQEIADCSLVLSPQQLYLVAIGPSTVDFGQVCVRSSSLRHLELSNSLGVHVWVQVEVCCLELQRSGSLSHVLPPLSRASLPLVFESVQLGPFRFPLSYTVNGRHSGHVLVQGDVVPVALELSTSNVELCPTQSGYRGVVTLYNRCNRAAEFAWTPVPSESGVSFSISPAAGSVPPRRELDCDLLWFASFSSPQEGSFDLRVHEGNTARLRCVAKVGSASVQLAERHLVFDGAPLSISTVRRTMLHNTGHQDAFFQVSDVHPVLGMTVSPQEGVVPAGGQTEIEVLFTPEAVVKFDTRVEIALRNARALELRLGGSVTPPRVSIGVKSLQFHGVYCGSRRALPFSLENRSLGRAVLRFDLSRHREFSVELRRKRVTDGDPEPHTYSVEMDGQETVECLLVFCPKQVAAYDFLLPVTLNGLSPPSPPPSSVPKTLSANSKHIITPRSWAVSVATPTCRVQATALRAPLDASPSIVHFELQSSERSSATPDPQVLELRNISQEEVAWRFESTAPPGDPGDVFSVSPDSGTLEPEQSVCVSVTFSPGSSAPGVYLGGQAISTQLFLFLFEEKIHPYRQLHLSASVLLPSVTFRPPRLLLPPVPVDTSTRATVCLLLSGFARSPSLQVQVEKVQLKDGSELEPFSVLLPHGDAVPASGLVEPFICVVTFRSPSPVACTSLITFVDQENHSFQLQVCAVTENCLLTLWPHLALRRPNPPEVSNSGYLSAECGWSQLTDEAGLGSGSSSSSGTEQLLSGVLCSGPVCPESWPGGVAESSGRTEAWVASIGPRGGMSDDVSDGMSDDLSDRMGMLGLPRSPPRGSEEGLFFDAVLGATQRWFSQFGWPRGPNPVALPRSFRRAVCQVQASGSTHKKGGSSLPPALGARTVYDMVLHLGGQLPPGVGGGHLLCGSAPERVRLLRRRHGALLTFLSDQGASFPHVRPEHLLEPQDFRLWLSLQDQQDVLVTGSIKLDDEDFESLSRRVWTDVLLQTYKVFVLPRVTKGSWGCHPGCEDEDHTARDDLDPQSRNIYSTWERRLLTWLNCTFQKMRWTVWDPQLYDGDVPPPRCIANFDADLADGLVLATALAAYCPFLIPARFRRMFSSGSSLEQNLHNGLIVCRALRELRLPFHIQAAEISDPNPVQLLMLCVLLYEKLPQYLPRQTVALSGRLDDTWTRELCVKNPSPKRLVYHASIVGQEAPHFSLPHGATVCIPPHGHTKVLLQVHSSSLRPMEAVLLLTPRLSSHPQGATLSFTLRSRVTHSPPRGTVRCAAPCYELKRIQLRVLNPFAEDAEFRVLLVQSRENPLKAPLDTSVTEGSNFDSIIGVSEEQRNSQMDGTLEAPESNEAFLLDPGSETAVPEFFSPVRCVWLQAGGAAHLDLHYVPFHLGRVYCCVLLLGQEVGDLVYLVEATAELPLPTPLSAEPSPSVVSGRSSAFGERVLASFCPAWGASAPQAPLCFRCDVRSELREVLLVPVVNEAWERALATVGVQRMSALERERRHRAGTLSCSSVRRGVATWALGASQMLQPEEGAHTQAVLYTVQCSMPDCFILPECISLPVCRAARVSLWGERPAESPPGSPVCSLTLRFQPRTCGRYRCQLVLRSWRDVRVHCLEVVVHGNGSAALLEFSTTALSSVTQKIPLSNTSAEDWRLRVRLAGRGFHGPSQAYVGAGQTLSYPVSFKPTCKCIVQGSLSLLNDADDTEQTVTLWGVAERSRAQDHVLIHCPVGEVTQSLLHVPNYTQQRFTCKVISDLSIVSGPAAVHIKPGKVVPYTFSVSPWKRGTCRVLCPSGMEMFPSTGVSQRHVPGYFLPHVDHVPLSGVMSFVAEQLDEDVSATGGDEEGDLLQPYEVWFSLEVLCVPGEPVTVVPLQCTVQNSVTMEIPVSNPKPQPLQLQVYVEGVGLTGDTRVCVPPGGKSSYLVTFSPTTVGRKMGSIIFQSELVGEFWYQLDLLADSPKPTVIPPCTCELGRWKLVFIPLVNNTDEMLEMDVANSNPRNFRVLLDTRRPVTVAPHSSTQVPVQFYPSSLGPDHTACVSFTCTQLGRWRFLLSGRGQIPGTMEPLCLSTSPGSHTSIAVPFQNPTEHSVLAHVYLTSRPSGYRPEQLADDEQNLKEPLPSTSEESQQVEPQVFSVHLERTHGIPLAPQETLQVPVVFSPSCQQLAQTWLVVQLRRQDGCGWKCDVPEDKRVLQGRIPEISWVFPIHGVPESGVNPSHPAVITCGARCRVEEHVEVLLAGCVPSSSAPPEVFKHISSQGSSTPAAPVLAVLEDFLCELTFEDEEHKVQLEDSVSLSLLSQDRDPSSGIASLTFSIAFAPNRPIRCTAALAVRCVTGGLWKFPIMLVATDPQVDDVISIEAAALHRTAGVCFRLSSQSRHPEPFTATFLPGGGREFQVFPSSGTLVPLDTAGTLFTVTFTPCMYNRRRRAVLLVQTVVMQWTYQVEGIPPPSPHQRTHVKLQQDGALRRRLKNKV
ncbi:cilia- and flagella-associated protein 47-like isoform X2 [Scleropages formosus]|uniref:cilia- and flagella-associated protein 47-like isoform X2 n=2 Tax=Scleropages formosus TaxID=113540 RepID=UPI0010FA748B|nr:cilia- and flagella-associated protein 47 isoform X2 [Scleropages formosus]